MPIKSSELQRKITHILIGIIALLLIIYNIVTPFIIFIILVIGTLVSLISLKINIPIISFFLNTFERRTEKHLPARAVIFATTGSLLALQLFPRDIALASITILVFADPISHIIGKAFGKTKSPIDKRKNIEGHIAGALISSLFAMFLIRPALAIAGSITAMLFESLIIEIQKIELDDNLIIPLAAGTIMYVLRLMF
jgi:dolichol kinase